MARAAVNGASIAEIAAGVLTAAALNVDTCVTGAAAGGTEGGRYDKHRCYGGSGLHDKRRCYNGGSHLCYGGDVKGGTNVDGASKLRIAAVLALRFAAGVVAAPKAVWSALSCSMEGGSVIHRP